MKHKLIIILLVLCVGAASWPVYGYGQLKTAKLIATFDGKDKHYIDTVYCREKYETTFILPTDRKIGKAITGDPAEWEIEGKYGGRIISVKPLDGASHTSLTIITQSMQVYKFNIVNILTVENPGYDVIAIVEIREKNATMEVIGTPLDQSGGGGSALPLAKKATETTAPLTGNRDQYAEKKKEETLRNLDYGYRWKGKEFAIDNVYDDGLFTYIVMPQAREFPAVYVSSGGKKKTKYLEPIQYVVKPGLIVIHRLIRQKETFILRLGTRKDKNQKESVIYRKKGRGKR